MRCASDGQPSLEIEHLSVEYVTSQEIARAAGRLLRSPARRRRPRTVKALSDVSLRVSPGSVLGVIGRNGAGKSTLLRVVAGIIPPTSGRVVVRGRVNTLMRLGTGFNRTLSGRDNVVLGGLALGMDVPEIMERFPMIEDFAELGSALDSPMRSYSSGMAGRLGFAVGAALDADVLLVDEALSAGDAAFKEKCMAMMRARAEASCTVVLVSHALGVIRKMADECLWLDAGTVRAVGDPSAVIESYLEVIHVPPTAAAMEDV